MREPGLSWSTPLPSSNTVEPQQDSSNTQQPDYNSLRNQTFRRADFTFDPNQPLGSGAEGVVYEATHRKSGLVIALKQYYPFTFADHTKEKIEAAKDIFLAESRLAAGVRTPGFNEIYGGFVENLATGVQFYSAMQLERGVSIIQLTNHGQTGDEKALRNLIVPVAQTLYSLETNSPPIVHRDIKPHNVRKGERYPWILVDGQRVGIAGLTRLHSMTGTPEYSAPELAAAGDYTIGGMNVDGRADQFSLGMTALHYHLGNSRWAKAKFDHLDGARSEIPGLKRSEDLKAILEKMTARLADDRFANASELLKALKHTPVYAVQSVSPAEPSKLEPEAPAPHRLRGYMPVGLYIAPLVKQLKYSLNDNGYSLAAIQKGLQLSDEMKQDIRSFMTKRAGQNPLIARLLGGESATGLLENILEEYSQKVVYGDRARDIYLGQLRDLSDICSECGAIETKPSLLAAVQRMIHKPKSTLLEAGITYAACAYYGTEGLPAIAAAVGFAYVINWIMESSAQRERISEARNRLQDVDTILEAAGIPRHKEAKTGRISAISSALFR